jgi:chemosensory pili system protein ChpA (sensor histidine kinase/response regulator)
MSNIAAPLEQDATVSEQQPVSPMHDPPVLHDIHYPSLSGSDELWDADDRVVMVVDDDHAIREALKDLLSLLGFHVVSARDGEDALALLSDGCHPYAILLDLGMPRMDGWKFRNELLRDPRYAGLRVIVITASQNQHPETLGVSDVLTKPVPLQRLVEVLSTEGF